MAQPQVTEKILSVCLYVYVYVYLKVRLELDMCLSYNAYIKLFSC